MELLVNGVVVAQLAPPHELRWSTHALDEGTHTFAVKAAVGERTFVSEAKSLVVDRTAPRLVQQMPLPGTRTVSVRQTIQAVFSEALDPGTVTLDSVALLSDGSEIAAVPRLSSDGASLELELEEALPVDTVMSVRLAASLTDLAGNAVALPAEAWEWTAPGYLSLGAAVSSAPEELETAQFASLAVDADEQPVVAYVNGSIRQLLGVYVKRWNGSSWQPVGEVLGESGYGAYVSNATLRIPNGHAPLVAWLQSVSGSPISAHVRRWENGAWNAVGAPVTPLMESASVDFFAFDANAGGVMAMALREYRGGQSQVSVWHWDGVAWAALGGALKVNPTWLVNGVALMLDTTGRPVVLWGETGPDQNAQVYIQRWNGTGWEFQVPPLTGLFRGVALDASDSLIRVGAAQNSDGALDALVFRFDGSSWVRMGNRVGGLFPGTTDTVISMLGIDKGGDTVVLLSEPEFAGEPEVSYVQRWDGAAWSPVGGLLRPQPGRVPLYSRVAMNELGQSVLARIEAIGGDFNHTHLYVYRSNN
nr:Ig-like domain-containing protein [Myxococcus vastator]